MPTVEEILAEPTTPETARKVAIAIKDTQKTYPDNVGYVSTPIFDRLMSEYSKYQYVQYLLGSICGNMIFNKFTDVQITALAEFIVEKFAKKMVDPGQFVAMGGAPADDDDDVVIVEEDPVEKRIEDAKMKIKDAASKQLLLKSDGDKLVKLAEGTDTRRREAIAALRLATDEHNDSLRKLEINAAGVSNAEAIMKAAQAEFFEAMKARSEAHKDKRPRRQ
jgi:hypothetical protein